MDQKRVYMTIKKLVTDMALFEFSIKKYNIEYPFVKYEMV